MRAWENGRNNLKKKEKDDGEMVEKEGDERSIKNVYDTIMMRSSLLPITGRQMLVVHNTVQFICKGRSPHCLHIVSLSRIIPGSTQRIHCGWYVNGFGLGLVGGRNRLAVKTGEDNHEHDRT